MDKKRQQQAYENYVKQKTPVHNLPANMTKAFVTGGAICVLGQGILNICEKAGLDKDISGGWCSMLLVFLSAVLTGFNVYPRIAKWGGAGALVPITGFANSVAAPAIEYKKEGQVMGIGCKIFTIAGPVILYGIFTRWIRCWANSTPREAPAMRPRWWHCWNEESFFSSHFPLPSHTSVGRGNAM